MCDQTVSLLLILVLFVVFVLPVSIVVGIYLIEMNKLKQDEIKFQNNLNNLLMLLEAYMTDKDMRK